MSYFPDNLHRRKALAESVSRQQKWHRMRDEAGLDMYVTMNDRQARASMNSLSFNIGKVEN